MRRAVAVAGLAAGVAGGAAGGALADQPIAVPSGQVVTLQDVIWGPGPEGLVARFRFLAPAIARDGGTVDFETAAADMEYLCNTYAIPRVETVTGPRPEQIIVTLADRAVPFGSAAPEATQFIDTFHLTDGRCIWEPL
jgi:hypothetical protein